MPRAIPADRFPQLITAATNTFVARGYRLTQMADIAEALGVAKGTLYGYVESKEALFDAAVRLADARGTYPEPSELPLATPAQGSTIRFIEERLAAEAQDLALLAALSGRKIARARSQEFEAILRDLYRRMSSNRRALKLIDRCAPDHPELASVWFEQGRYGQVALLATYLEKRIDDRQLRAVANVQLAARMILETLALWAIHMPWDLSPRTYAENEVEDAVVDLLVHAHKKEMSR